MSKKWKSALVDVVVRILRAIFGGKGYEETKKTEQD